MLSRVWSLLSKSRDSAIVCAAIIATALVALSPLLRHGYINGHDTIWHMSSIAAIADQLPSSLIDIRVVGKIFNDFGYPIGIFYPQLAHVAAAVIYKCIGPLGGTVYTSAKIVHFLILAGSGFAMYAMLRRINRTKRSLSLSIAIVYMLSSYHLSDILIRDTFGEELVFLFLPILGLALNSLKNEKYTIFITTFVFSCVGLVNSHLVLTLFAAVLCAIYCLVNYKDFVSPKKIKWLLVGLGIAALISSLFILPMLEQRKDAEIVVFSTDHMTKGREARAYINLDMIFSDRLSAYGNILFTQNIVMLGVVLWSVFNISKAKGGYKRNLILFVILDVLLIFVMIGGVRYEDCPEVIKMIQFFWRLDTFLTFFICVQAAIGLNCMKPDYRKLVIVSMMLVCISNLGPYFENVSTSTRKIGDEIGKSQRYVEYLPLKAYESVNLRSRDGEIHIVNGEAQITDIEKRTPRMNFSVKTNGARIELPLLYYLGYQVKNSDGEVLEYAQSNDGFIELDIEKDSEVEIRYIGTPAMRISKMLFYVGMSAGIVAVIYAKNYERKRHLLTLFYMIGPKTRKKIRKC